jgi:hypothetical protein
MEDPSLDDDAGKNWESLDEEVEAMKDLSSAFNVKRAWMKSTMKCTRDY